MLKDRTYDRTVHRSLYAAESAGTGGTKGVADNYREKLHAAHSRVMRSATNGLVGFNDRGEIVMAVDPSRIKEGGVSHA